MSLNNWPTGADFSRALDSPSFAFSEPEWKEAKMVMVKGGHGQKVMASGRFATVFRAKLPDNTHWAVRCFTTNTPDRQKRYEQISSHINPIDQNSPFVDFNYAQEGIRLLDMNRYPLIRMKWVEGVTMFKWVTTQCQSNNTDELESSLPKWLELIRKLKTRDIAHGDLQHGNVMFTNSNEMKLVDYDGMCVPSLQGADALERGVVPYQHPSRGGGTKLTTSLDDFSSIFIYVGLFALAKVPSLWQQFVIGEDYEKLLFQKEDLEAPDDSELFNALKSKSPEAYELSYQLSVLYNNDIDKVPVLDDFLFPWDSVYNALRNKSYRQVVKLSHEAGSRKPPADLVKPIANAGKRVACLDQIIPQTEDYDERSIASIYDSELLSDWPESQPLLAGINAALEIPPIYDEIQPLDKSGKWAQFLQGFNNAKGKLTAYPNGLLCKELFSLQQRIKSCDDILQGLKKITREDAPDLKELQQTLAKIKDEGPHPETPDGLIDLAADQIKRATLWNTWLSYHESPISEKRDIAVLQGWAPKYFDSWVTSIGHKDELDISTSRLAIVKELSRLIQMKATDIAHEEALKRTAETLPSDYQYSFVERIEDAKVRIACRRSILQLHGEDPIHEIKIARQWQLLVEQSSEHLLPEEVQKRCNLALKRAPLVLKIAKLPPKTDLANRDRKLVSVWNPELLDACDHVAKYKTEFVVAAKRLAVIEKLQQAVTEGAEVAYLQLVDSEELKPYFTAGVDFDQLITCAPIFSQLIKQTRLNHENVEKLKTFIIDGNAEEFIQLYVGNENLMDSYKTNFEDVSEIIPIFIQKEIVPKVRLKKNDFGDSLVWRQHSSIARWQWPVDGKIRRLLSKCIVGVARGKMPDEPNKSELLTRESVWIDQYEQSGGKDLPHFPQWNGARVMVWGELKIAGNIFYTKPVLLGTMDHAK